MTSPVVALRTSALVGQWQSLLHGTCLSCMHITPCVWPMPCQTGGVVSQATQGSGSSMDGGGNLTLYLNFLLRSSAEVRGFGSPGLSTSRARPKGWGPAAGPARAASTAAATASRRPAAAEPGGDCYLKGNCTDRCMLVCEWQKTAAARELSAAGRGASTTMLAGI